jgi:hypothetical protein
LNCDQATAGEPVSPKRVLLSSPMKCGSTYAALILARYLGSEVPDVEYEWTAEHMLTHDLRAQLGDRPYVLTLHMRPHNSNLYAIRDDGMQGALQWRNVADTIVSFDDHTRRYGAHNPLFYVDQERFTRLPAQERYRHLIDRIVPWNLGFYLAWRRLGDLYFHPYEEMVRDPFTFFRSMLWQLGAPLDDERLREALADLPEGSRFNVGLVGRSTQLFDDETKRRIERHIVEHPEFDELEVLLWELPWEPRELARISPLDGTTVRLADDETCWFVSRGIRRRVTGRWMASRALPALRAPAVVAAEDLGALAEGEPLS